MNEYESDLQCRNKVEETKFFYELMKAFLQDRVKFRYCLDAFLSSARTVTLVFQKELKGNDSLMNWYKSKIEEWKSRKIMKFFRELRNISLKEQTPNTRTRRSVIYRAGKEQCVTPLLPLEVKDYEIIGFSFLHDFEWFDKSPDVMALCKEYLEELDKFVLEVEKMASEEGREQT